MFGSNPFGALADERPSNAVAGPSLSQVDGEETDADWLQLSKTNGEVYLRVSDKVELDGLPQECNLMAVSNTYGLVAVGGQSDVRIHKLEEIHRLLEESTKDVLPVSSPVAVLSLPARPVWVKLAFNEERLVVAMADGAGVCLFKLGGVVNGNTTPYSTVTSNIPPHLIDVLPNPAAASSSDKLNRNAALITPEGFVMLDIERGELAGQTAGSYTCGCWSAKGKQIVLGTKAGTIEQYTPDGTRKSRIPAPPELEPSEYNPTFVRWLENDLFLACYARIEAEDPRDPLEVFIIQRTKQSITYTKYFDINDSMGVENRTGNHRFYVDLKQWGPTSKHLGFMASSIGTEIGVLHGAVEGDGSLWQAVFLGEMARGVLPGAKKGVFDEDTSVLAMEVDLTATKPVVRGMEGGVDLPDLPPPPRLLVYSQAGLLISFDVRYPDVGAYPGMFTPQDIASVTASGDNEDMYFGTGANTPAPAEKSKPPATPSAFGASSTSTKPAFGASAFGPSSTPSAFGQSSGFGSSAFGSTTPSSPPAPKAAFGQSAFGSSTTPSAKPAFGESAFGSTTPAPKSAFGQSPFGSATTSATPASKPAFGQSPFGSTTPSTTPAAKPAFGQSAFASTTPSSIPDSKPAFGQSAFGAVASGSSTPVSKPTFGQTAIPAFGQSSTPAPSPFGQAAFGQSSKPAFGSSSFGQSSAPAFGQSTFGAAGSPSAAATKPTGALGSSAFGQSAFGQSAFGQSAKPSQASAFGQAAEKPDSAAKSAFSFAGKADSSSTGFGSSAFGSGGSSPFAKKEATTPTFGSSPNPFAQAAPSSSPFGSGGSAFGSSAFGKPATSAFDTKSAFGKSPSQGTPSPPADTQPTTGLFGSTKPVTPASKSSEDDFGLGGFASALGASSGPASPSEAKSAAPSGKSRVPGLEDSDEEEDDSSSKPKPSTTAGTTSAFIKPATGFAQASSNGFGVFGQTASAPKTAPSSTPAAFSAPPPATSAFGKPASTPGGVAFGQSSKPGGSFAFGQPSIPAAGGAAFGKPSAPVAFGQAATPATTGFGNISGGFGGFGKASTGGFGGFASSSSGESIFAKKEDKPLGPTIPAFGAKPASTVPVFGQSKQSSAPVFGAKTATPQPAAKSPASKQPEVKVPTPATPSPLSSPALTASSVEDDAVEPEPAVMPAGYATTPAAPPKSPVAPKAAQPEPAVIPPGYDVPGEIPAPAESAGDDVAPAIVEAASAVPLPPTESPAPIRLPPVETITAQLPPAVRDEGGNDSRPADISPTKSLDEGVLVEREEAPSAASGQDAQDYGSDHEYDDEYDYEEEVEGEGEEYDTEENDDEEDDDEEDSAASRRRRSVSLAPPEMSPIAEEPGDLDEAEDGESVDDDSESVDDDEQSEDDREQSGGEDGGDDAARPPLKSPPAWFSNTAPSGPNVPSSSEGGASDSLFGRLGPAPSDSAAPKLPPAFSLKHAVKTSSPLGQPPQTADRSPPGTSTKPASSAFSAFANASNAAKDGQSAFGANRSGFGQGLGLGKPPLQAARSPSEETKPVFSGFGLGQTTSQVTPSSAQDTKPVFGGFGQSSTDTKPAVTKPAFSGFGLGQTAAQPAPAKAPEDKPTFGGFGSTVKTDMPSADAKPSFGGFGGFGRTATSSQTACSAAEGFVGFGQHKSSTPAASHGGLFGAVKPGPSAPPPPAAPAAPPTDFSIPPRQPVPTVRDVPSDGKRTMTAVLERMIASLLEDIHQLRATLAQNERYHQSFTIANFPKITADNLDKHATLPFSSLDEFRGIVDALSTEVAQIVSDQAGVDVKLSDVQSKLLKSDMKVGQAEKFVQARQDPSFAGVMQIKELSIDQAESQARLREMVQATEDTLTELEAGIANLKKRVEHQNEARSDDSDALDRVQRAVRDMDTTIRDHAETIDELAGRIASIRVGTPSRRRESTPSRPINAVKRESMAATSLQPSAAVTKAVQDSLARQSKLRARLVARSGETARLTTLDPKAGGTGVLSHVSLVDGPISIDATPLPGTVDVKPDESGAKASSLSFATKDSASTPTALPNAMATGTAAPTSMFGNITFGKLDPGTITRASAAERKSATSGGSSRGHQSAPKFGGGLVGSGAAKSSETPSMSFVPPPPATGSKAAPSGFFSLSSFNK